MNAPDTRFAGLDFVSQGRDPEIKMRNFWRVPTATDYGLACIVGATYAQQFLNWRRTAGDTGCVLLARIAKAQARVPENDDAQGFAVGFWGVIDDELATVNGWPQ